MSDGGQYRQAPHHHRAGRQVEGRGEQQTRGVAGDADAIGDRPGACSRGGCGRRAPARSAWRKPGRRRPAAPRRSRPARRGDRSRRRERRSPQAAPRRGRPAWRAAARRAGHSSPRGSARRGGRADAPRRAGSSRAGGCLPWPRERTARRSALPVLRATCFSVQVSSKAPSQAAVAAASCTCQPPGASSNMPATMTPSAGDLRDRQVDEDDALAQHLRPEGHVGREHQHAGGERRQQDREVDGGRSSFRRRQQQRTRAVEQAEQVGRLVVAADREGQRRRRGCRPARRASARRAASWYARAHHHLRRLRRQLRLELAELPAVRFDAGLGLERRDLAHARASSRGRSCSCGVRPRAARAAARLLLPLARSPSFQRLGEGLQPVLVDRRVRRVDLRQACASAAATFSDVARIELDVRIARGMDIAVAAIEPRRHVERHDEATGLEVSRRTRREPGVRRLLQQHRQPARLRAPCRCRPAGRRRACARSGSGRASMRCGSCKAVVVDVTLTLVAAELRRQRRPFGLAGDDVEGGLRLQGDRGQGGEAEGAGRSRHGVMRLLELVSAVRTQAHDVLKEDLPVGPPSTGCGRRRTAGAGG